MTTPTSVRITTPRKIQAPPATAMTIRAPSGLRDGCSAAYPFRRDSLTGCPGPQNPRTGVVRRTAGRNPIVRPPRDLGKPSEHFNGPTWRPYASYGRWPAKTGNYASYMQILGLILIGLIIGAVARLLIPGRQKIGLGLTLLLGVAGAIVGGVIASLIGTGDIFELNFLGTVVGIIAAVGFIGAADAAGLGKGERRDEIADLADGSERPTQREEIDGLQEPAQEGHGHLQAAAAQVPQAQSRTPPRARARGGVRGKRGELRRGVRRRGRRRGRGRVALGELV